MTRDLIDQLADAASEPPDETTLRRVSEKAQELTDAEAEVRRLEELLSAAKTRRHELRTRDLPDLMKDVGVDRIGVPGGGYDVVLAPKIHANISKEWTHDRREEAFAHLREIGGGDLIKNTLTVEASRKSDEKMRQLADRVRQMLAEYDLEASVRLEPAVQWNSLTAFVKREILGGDAAVDLEKIGASYEERAEIVKKEN